jgi:hypothetical protein
VKQRRLFSVPPPLEGDEGTLLVSFCVPNSKGWRDAAIVAVSQLEYGRAWDENTGRVLDALEIGRQVFANMSMCDLDELTKAIKQLNATIAGAVTDLTLPVPDDVDYSITGLGPRITALELKLEEIRAIQASGEASTDANLDDVEEILDGIGQILGAAAILGV